MGQFHTSVHFSLIFAHSGCPILVDLGRGTSLSHETLDHTEKALFPHSERNGKRQETVNFSECAGVPEGLVRYYAGVWKMLSSTDSGHEPGKSQGHAVISWMGISKHPLLLLSA